MPTFPDLQARDTACTTPPSDFTPIASFSDVCSTRYCASSASSTLVWAGNSGDITRAEIESAVQIAVTSAAVSTLVGQGNILAYGHAATAAYGAGLLFEFTGDLRALDVAVRFANK